MAGLLLVMVSCRHGGASQKDWEQVEVVRVGP